MDEPDSCADFSGEGESHSLEGGDNTQSECRAEVEVVLALGQRFCGQLSAPNPPWMPRPRR